MGLEVKSRRSYRVHTPPRLAPAPGPTLDVPEAPLPRAHQVTFPTQTSFASALGAGFRKSAPALLGVAVGVVLVPTAAHVLRVDDAQASPRVREVPAGTGESAVLFEARAATPTPEERELADKILRLVNRSFGGSFQRGFAHYDANKDGGIDRDELLRLLEDAGVGNWLTRGAWADGILEKLDTSGNGKIEYREFQRALPA